MNNIKGKVDILDLCGIIYKNIGIYERKYILCLYTGINTPAYAHMKHILGALFILRLSMLSLCCIIFVISIIFVHHFTKFKPQFELILL
jgi:hypothetical protein